MKPKRFYFVFSIVCTALFVAPFIVLAVLVCTNNSSPLATMLLLIVIIAFALAAYFGITRFIRNRTEEKRLQSQAEYNFGIKSVFYSPAVFEAKAMAIRRNFFTRNKSQHLIAFSGSTHDMMNNRNRRKTITDFNAATILYLKETLDHSPDGRFIYCFNEGVFLIFACGPDRSKILLLCHDINEKLYQIAEQKNLHIPISPYFGVESVKPNDELIASIENANLARDLSERYFDWITFYSNSMRNVSSGSDSDEILSAMENKEFVIYYQPKYNLTSNAFTSSEALVRWNSPVHGFMQPGQFIPRVEASGLIHELDVYVFERVCQDLSETKKRGRRLLPVSLNFSLFEFYSPTFLDMILSTIKKYNIDPKLIEIEITETTSQSNTFLSTSIIKKLKEHGMKVLMDDFGIGYSNIGNLQIIPFDTIKIDKSYVDNIVNDPKAKEIVKTLISLGKINGMEVIAEGADSKEQVEILKDNGCDTIQGFYYSMPLPKDDYDKFLSDNPFEAKEEEEK